MVVVVERGPAALAQESVEKGGCLEIEPHES